MADHVTTPSNWTWTSSAPVNWHHQTVPSTWTFTSSADNALHLTRFHPTTPSTWTVNHETITLVKILIPKYHPSTKSNWSWDSSCALPQSMYTLMQRTPSGEAPQISLFVVDTYGVKKTSLVGADFKDITTALDLSAETFTFTMPTRDKRIRELKMESTAFGTPPREIQLWVGGQLFWWGRPVKIATNNDITTIQCKNLWWYFTRNLIGKEIPNHIRNGNFSLISGANPPYWMTTTAIGSRDYPRLSIASDDIDGNALTMSATGNHTQWRNLPGEVLFDFNKFTLRSEAQDSISAMTYALEQGVTVECHGHTDNVGSVAYNMTLSENRANAVAAFIRSVRPDIKTIAVGHSELMPIASNSTASGRQQNRRVELIWVDNHALRGHQQALLQINPMYDPGYFPTTDHKVTLCMWVKINSIIELPYEGWLAEIIIRDNNNNPIVTKFITYDSKIPLGTWTRVETEFDLPAINAPSFLLRIYPPEGSVTIDRVSLTTNRRYIYNDVEQASIVTGLIDHMRTDRNNIDTNIWSAATDTGQKRTREYEWIERKKYSDALEEFPKLLRGMEFSWMYTESGGSWKRWLKTHYPERAQRGVGVPVYTCSTETNIVEWQYSTNLEQSSNTVIVQASNESGSDREEWWEWSAEPYGPNFRLEKAYQSTPGSMVSTLDEQAKRGLDRYAKNVQTPSVTLKPANWDLMYKIFPGDYVKVRINSGWVDVDAVFRVMQIKWDLGKGQPTLVLADSYKVSD